MRGTSRVPFPLQDSVFLGWSRGSLGAVWYRKATDMRLLGNRDSLISSDNSPCLFVPVWLVPWCELTMASWKVPRHGSVQGMLAPNPYPSLPSFGILPFLSLGMGGLMGPRAPWTGEEGGGKEMEACLL